MAFVAEIRVDLRGRGGHQRILTIRPHAARLGFDLPLGLHNAASDRTSLRRQINPVRASVFFFLIPSHIAERLKLLDGPPASPRASIRAEPSPNRPFLHLLDDASKR